MGVNNESPYIIRSEEVNPFITVLKTVIDQLASFN